MSPPPDDAPDTVRVLGKPVDVSLVAANLPFVLRTAAGTAVLGIGSNIVGVVVVGFVVQAMNATANNHQLAVVLTTAGIMTAVSVIAGLLAATLVQRRTLRWMLRGERPSTEDAHRALRMPRDMAVIAAILWAIGSVVIGTAAAVVGEDAQTILGIAGGILLAGFTSAGITYLLVGRASQPVARLALAACPPETAPVFGVRWRLLVTWILTSGTPIVGLVFVLSAPHKTHVLGTSIVVALIALAVGGFSTALIARAIGAPLRGMVDAMHQVGQGDLDVVVPIEDAGEIGLVQAGFNDMVSGLRERERIQDLFGRHVGSAVAAEAISSGVTMSGESREVVALFADITSSTRLTLEKDPSEFVAMLNRFFEIVVEEVETNGGLLNKFEGDAVLCVFGAPVELDDPATAALCTARVIRDRVVEMGEFDVGIGVAAGQVIAGQIGAASRLEYTVIGDAVNEAARLTELAKRVDGRILASEPTVEAATPEEREHWIKGRVLRLRGREAPTRSYRTAGPTPSVRTSPGNSLTRRISDAAKIVTELPQHGSHERE